MKKLALLFLLASPLAMAVDRDLPVTLVAPSKLFPNPTDLTANALMPDPLVTMLGTPVKTRAEWEKDRAPELRRHYVCRNILAEFGRGEF